MASIAGHLHSTRQTRWLCGPGTTQPLKLAAIICALASLATATLAGLTCPTKPSWWAVMWQRVATASARVPGTRPLQPTPKLRAPQACTTKPVMPRSLAARSRNAVTLTLSANAQGTPPDILRMSCARQASTSSPTATPMSE
eukprot:COSAG01_NODE_1758_length_9310_cov_10.992183_2_plen_142_part_00